MSAPRRVREAALDAGGRDVEREEMEREDEARDQACDDAEDAQYDED